MDAAWVPPFLDFPPRRGGVDAPSRAKAQTGWSDRHSIDFADLTTPSRQLLLSCRATPPLRGGEFVTKHDITVPPLWSQSFRKDHESRKNIDIFQAP